MTTPPPDDCEVVSWHSRQKHEFVQAYLSIWTDHVGRRKGSQAPSLEIVDLFGAWGWCRSEEPSASSEPWPGTAVLAAQALAKYQNPKRLFVNTFDPRGGEFQARQAAALRRAVGKAAGERPPFRVQVEERNLTDAVVEAEKVVNFQFPSLWLLDPYAPDQLPWTVVDRIAGHVATYEHRGKGQSRRPELIISLMTHALQRNVDLAPRLIDTALGMAEGEWRPKLDQLRSEGMNTREALVAIYAERLKALYGRDPIVLEVHGTEGIVVYELVLCTSHEAGQYMTLVDKLPKYSQWKEAEWRPKARLISQNKRIVREGGESPKIQRGIFEFDEQP